MVKYIGPNLKLSRKNSEEAFASISNVGESL